MRATRRLFFGLFSTPGLARAQGWVPDRAVTLLHGFAAGGAADTIARIVAPSLAEALGKPVVVEARPGAGGNIASAALARAQPDGQTIGLLTGSHGVAAAFSKTSGFDPVDSFAWISVALRYAFVFAVRSDNPKFPDLRRLIEVARAEPGGVQYGTLGPGSSHHLTGELFSQAAGIELTQIPYRGDNAGLTAVLSGELPVMCATVAGAMALLDDPRLRGLGVTADRRSRRFPAIPTVAEAGGLPGFRSYTWAGLAAPAGTPMPIQEGLHTALVKALAVPATRQKLEELTDGEVEPSTLAATRGLVIDEIAAWRRLIAARNLKAD